MFLVVVRALVEAKAGAQAANVTGLSAADLRHRLQGALPRVLMSDADGDKLTAISDRLDELGFITLVCDPRLAPTDADRVLAKSFRIEPDQLVAIDGGGGEHDVPWTAIEAIQRGSRTHIQKIEEKTVTQKFDATRAVLSGGLILTRKAGDRHRAPDRDRRAVRAGAAGRRRARPHALRAAHGLPRRSAATCSRRAAPTWKRW